MMDIVDAQLHLGPHSFEDTLAQMDALGIRSVLVDEYWVDRRVAGSLSQANPGYILPGGAWRTISPVAELASALHPDRFAYFVRVDRNDPDLLALMRILADNPNVRALRFVPVMTLAEADFFTSGGYDPIFAAAADMGLPICIYVPGYVEHLAPYAARHPDVQFVIDHGGMGVPTLIKGRDPAEEARTSAPSYFDEILQIARYPNVALKLSHLPMMLQGGAYPFAPVRPYLRRAIDAFGPERLLWATDQTVMKMHSWADLLNYILLDPAYTEDEKAWILGKAARRIFNWPAAD